MCRMEAIVSEIICVFIEKVGVSGNVSSVLMHVSVSPTGNAGLSDKPIDVMFVVRGLLE